MKYRMIHKKYLQKDQILQAYDMLVEEGKLPFLFYDGGVQSFEGFLNWVTAPTNWFVIGYDAKAVPVGLFWLNGFQARTAQFHFALFDTSEGKIEVCQDALEWLKEQDFLDSVYGLTPKPFFPVMRLFRKVGFEIRGELPGACYMSSKDKYVPGIISVLDFNHIQGDKHGRQIDPYTSGTS